jgi:hypothetical protein
MDKCPDVKIVISSAWRIGMQVEDLRELLHQHDIDSSRVIDKTPAKLSYRPRGNEIRDWFRYHEEDGGEKIEDFVILDDNDDMDPYMDHLFQTDFDVGLTITIAKEVVRRLGGNESLFLKPPMTLHKPKKGTPDE